MMNTRQYVFTETLVDNCFNDKIYRILNFFQQPKIEYFADTLLPEKTQNSKRSPFELTQENGRLYGCGVSDNKAPLLCWFNALKIYKMTKYEIPVNIKFVIEGTSELYSRSLLNAIRSKRDFFNDVEYICLTIDKKVNETPCLKYGYRGLCHFSLLVSCGEKRVHSGTFGGAFNQPLMDAVNIVGSLLDKKGKITVPAVSSLRNKELVHITTY